MLALFSTEDRTLTIDVNPAEYSYIPHPQKESNTRTQRSALYDTNTYYGNPETDYRYGSNPEDNGVTPVAYGTERRQEQVATIYGQENNGQRSNDSSSYYYGSAQTAANNTTTTSSPYDSYYSSQQQQQQKENATTTSYNTSVSSVPYNNPEVFQYDSQSANTTNTDALESTQGPQTNDSNAEYSVQVQVYLNSTNQDVQNQTSSFNLTSEVSVSQLNTTENSTDLLSNSTDFSDQHSAEYTTSEQAPAPAQTPSSAPAAYPAYAPYQYPSPYPAPYPAPYPSPYPAPSYAPYPSPYPAYAPYSYPSPASYSSYPAPSPAPAPAPAPEKDNNNNSKYNGVE